MEQRPLRLGDILDDYCPRERRLTNHAIVAMIEDDIRQTRCTTCDAEHAYKGGKVPKRRKKETPAALYKEVLAGMPDTEAAPVLASPAPATADAVAADRDAAGSADAAPVAAPVTAIDEPAVPQVQHAAPAAQPAPPSEDEPIEVEEGPVHRPLIRAQLPRIEGQKEERRLPEFTIRQATRGPGHFRGPDSRMKQQRAGGPGSGPGNGNGNRPHGGPRFAGSRPPGPGRGPSGRGGPAAGGGGFRAGQPRHGGGKKRSR
jgi:translation initiation factor IF-2